MSFNKRKTMRMQYREIGESSWMGCDIDWYTYCQNSAIYDTRMIK